MKTSLFRNVPVAPAPSGAASLLFSNASLSTLHKVLGLAIALLAQSTPAQTWQTVDDFQYSAGMSAGNYGLAVALNGTLFAGGFGLDSSGVHGLVMASTDGGNTWSNPLDDFMYPGVSATDLSFLALH